MTDLFCQFSHFGSQIPQNMFKSKNVSHSICYNLIEVQRHYEKPLQTHLLFQIYFYSVHQNDRECGQTQPLILQHWKQSTVTSFSAFHLLLDYIVSSSVEKCLPPCFNIITVLQYWFCFTNCISLTRRGALSLSVYCRISSLLLSFPPKENTAGHVIYRAVIYAVEDKKRQFDFG